MNRTNRLGRLAPYLLASFFVLHLLAGSGGELVRARDLVIPLTCTFLLAALVHGCAWMCTKNDVKAALIACVAVVGFASFGLALLQTRLQGTLGPSAFEMSLLAVYLLAGACIIAAIGFSSRHLNGLLTYTTLVGTLLVGWNGWVGARSLGSARRLPPLPPSRIQAPRELATSPDVLLLILDKYTGSRTLNDLYGFDNRQFEAALRRYGFQVPAAPRTNYVQTFLSLAAFLNFSYLDPLVRGIDPTSRNRRPYYTAIESSRAAAFFRERGYRFVFMPTAWGATRQNRYADLQLPDPKAIRSEFLTIWYKTTPLPTLNRLTCWALGCTMPLSYVPETAAMLDWKFEQLARLPGQARPVFVLAHFTIPHEPYLYLANCQHRPPYWPNRDDGADSAAIRDAYLQQIKCVNQKVENVVRAWKARSHVPPVILIQGDHGHGFFGRELPPLEKVTAEQIRDRVSVFAAYLIPGAETVVHDTITPINAMRYMLRTAFQADLPPLEDATYWSAFDAPSAMTKIR